MRIILVAVMSLDGKITRWNETGASDWSSVEDQRYFADILAEKSVSIMGSGTYDVAKPMITTIPGKLRIVLTSKPEKYQRDTIVGALDFWGEAPEAVVQRLRSLGYESAYLLGGSELYNAFLKRALVTDVWLTVEPRIFGSGKCVAGENELDVSLQLVDVEKLNDRGTILLKYEVL